MEKIAESDTGSSPVWEQLEQHARARVRQFIQRVLEEEADEVPGRRKSERRTPTRPNYRGEDHPFRLAN